MGMGYKESGVHVPNTDGKAVKSGRLNPVPNTKLLWSVFKSKHKKKVTAIIYINSENNHKYSCCIFLKKSMA